MQRKDRTNGNMGELRMSGWFMDFESIKYDPIRIIKSAFSITSEKACEVFIDATELFLFICASLRYQRYYITRFSNFLYQYYYICCARAQPTISEIQKKGEIEKKTKKKKQPPLPQKNPFFTQVHCRVRQLNGLQNSFVELSCHYCVNCK
jgi:hypothetical protein